MQFNVIGKLVMYKYLVKSRIATVLVHHNSFLHDTSGEYHQYRISFTVHYFLTPVPSSLNFKYLLVCTCLPTLLLFM